VRPVDAGHGRARRPARVLVADGHVQARRGRRHREPREGEDHGPRRDRRQLVRRDLLARVERRHRAIAPGRQHGRHRGARHRPAGPQHALGGEGRAQEVAFGVDADRRDERGREAEPRSADRRDRPAAGRAQEVMRVALLTGRGQRLEPGERQVDEREVAACDVDAHPGNASLSAGSRSR
jgi:hypothetical protein